jgi:hypothetical protein
VILSLINLVLIPSAMEHTLENTTRPSTRQMIPLQKDGFLGQGWSSQNRNKSPLIVVQVLWGMASPARAFAAMLTVNHATDVHKAAL